MAVTEVGGGTGGAVKTSGTALPAGSITADIDDVIVIAVAYDNVSASAPTLAQNLARPGGETNTWNYLNVPTGNASAAAAARTALAWIRATVAWSAFSITPTASTTVTAKAWVWARYAGVNNTGITSVTARDVSTGLSLSYTNASGGMVVYAVGNENPNAPTSGSSGITPSYSLGTSGGNSATNINASVWSEDFSSSGPGGTSVFNGVDLSGIRLYLPPAPAAASTGKVKVWTGSAWVEKPIKVWSGSAWVEKPLKVWDGSSWVLA